jgi:hypothetical protein
VTTHPPPPETSPPRVRPPGIDPTPHLRWARSVGVCVAKRYRLRGHECDDLISVAYLEVIRLARRFDPGQLEYGDPGHLFRGWCKLALWTVCKRAAVNMRCGGLSGLVRAASGGPPVVVEPLSGKRTPKGDPMEVSHKGW